MEDGICPQESNWLDDLRLEYAPPSLRQSIKTMVNRWSAKHGYGYQRGWCVLYDKYERASKHKLEKSKVPKIEQVEKNGNIKLLYKIASEM